MAISASAVMKLREKTDLPMMECKQALVEADGDEEKAIEILREKSGKALDKRRDNPTGEGRIFLHKSDDGTQAAMVEIQCESEPVAKGEDFGSFGEQALQVVTESGADTAEALLSQPTPGGDGATLQQTFDNMVGKIREKMVVSRCVRVAGPVGGYVHHDGKTGVLFQAQGDGKDDGILRDVAMHIAALQPTVTNIDELDEAEVAAERERLSEEARATGKPDNIIEKIVDGRMNNFYVQKGVLVLQPFAKDDSKTVKQALAEKGYEAVGFHRWVIGS